jgi:hypothetical protein
VTTFKHTQLTALGDTIVTRRTYDEGGRFTHEDIEVSGPPELVSAPRGGGSGLGRDIYHHGERPRREIWHEPGRYP